MTWRRADLGDIPAVGQEIVLCEHRLGDHAVRQWRRMRAEVIFENPVRVLGPGLPCSELETDWPERPDDIVGRAVFWKPYEETI